ncbi:TRAP transporter substrate-binding protein [Rhodoplanes sp. TEM]|uniref:TRAP transporter substrate-binding protein n=1 Tax=Rhodoplanes tepidamans TaxID=200616 RepID=A0ABT5J4K9_RHOTP|nr:MULTISPECIES: TRAP transporter substrate-binding protein [Rhodoplanes]MDC7784356.1 TRAP transporter substrate-binding protein [Rhodoplanes tepidamans]MDC7983380.1 TRAP transporter substrate-binding protein [Rhodoplanes sp. TEM]MDQ0354516.1 TRAP-type C4-dicarboxylate transport system substrate-binding protein [Rhodoplanes tepidamans]
MKTLMLAATAATLAALTFTAPAAAQQPIILKVHSFSSPQAPEAVYQMLPWIEKVNKESNGRLKVEFYPSMQLGGKTSDLIQQLEDGVVDIVMMNPGVAPNRFPVLQGTELPFTNVGTSAGQTPAMLEWVNKWLLKNEFKGIKIIHMHATDAAVLHTRTKKIETAADLKGLKIRVPGRFVGEAMKSLGATPVGLPLSDIYESLQRGQIDGMTINWAIMTPYKLQEVTKFNMETPFYQNAIMSLMSQASYDKLPADLKKVIDDNIGIAYSTEVAKKIDELTVPAKKTIADSGNTLYSLSPEELAKWRAAMAPVYKLWIAEMDKKGLPGQAMFDDLLATTAKYGRK